MILVAFPLFIYLAVLYRAEYKEQKDDILITLNILASQISNNIEDNLKFKNEIIEVIKEQIKQNRSDLNVCFGKIAQDFNLDAIFYVDQASNDLYVVNSSKPAFIDRYIKVSKNMLDSKNTLFADGFFGCNSCLYYSKAIYDNKKSIGAIIVGFSQDEFLQDLPRDKYFKNTKLQIVDASNKVIFSNNQKPLKSSDVLSAKKGLKNLDLDLILKIDQKTVKAFHLQNYFFKHTFVFSTVFIVLLILSFIIISYMAKPEKALIGVMNKIKDGNLNKRYKKHFLGFEINYIGAFFNKTIDSLILKQKEVEKEKIEKQRYVEELEIAEDIQIGLLPKKPLDIEEVDISFGNLFAKEVGGDFYDFFTKDGKIFFVIADIATKGILACLYALTLRSIIRSFATYLPNLDEIVEKTNELFIKDAKENSMFATAFFGLYDIKSKNLKYFNAGHPKAILRKKDSTITELTTKGLALGIEDFRVDINETTLASGDLLFLYTDGIIEAIDKNNKFFGKEHLIDFIKNSKDIDVNKTIQRLFKILQDFSKDVSQFDDMTALIFKIK